MKRLALLLLVACVDEEVAIDRLALETGPRHYLVTLDSAGIASVVRPQAGGLVGDAPLAPPSGAALEWELLGTGFRPGDRHGDLFWRQRSSGTVIAAWTGDGVPVLFETLGIQPSSTRLGGIGDFDGDGTSEILWRQPNGQLVMWRNGTSLGAIYVGYSLNHRQTPVGLEWEIIATTDVEGDQRADILWRHRVTGDLWTWAMFGAGRMRDFMKAPSPGDQLLGMAIFGPDDYPDFLWRQPDGKLVIWEDGRPEWATPPFPGPDAALTFAGLLDVSGDGFADILWRKPDSTLVVWEMWYETVLAARDLPIVLPPVVARLSFDVPIFPPSFHFALVPNVIASTPASATYALQEKGFAVTRANKADPTCNRVGEVMTQSLPPGSIYPYGSVVNITVGTKPSLCR
jgi:PASTA domain